MATVTQSKTNSIDYVSSMQNSNKVPLKLKGFQLYIGFLSRFRRKKAVKLLTKIFFTPQRKIYDEEDLKSYGEVETHYINFESNQIFTYRAGEGPIVLLLHGWGSSSFTYRNLIPHITQAGFSVLTFDFPAHGLSEGKQTNLPQIARFVMQLEKQFGHFHTVLGHSMGGLVGLYSNSKGLKPLKQIIINSPTKFDSIIYPFFDLLGVPKYIQDDVVAEIARVANVDISELSGLNMELNEKISTLLIYDKDDQVIPYQDGERIHQKLQNSELLLTEKLGHKSALKDLEIINKMIEFIS